MPPFSCFRNLVHRYLIESLGRGSACPNTSTYTGQQQYRRKRRHVCISIRIGKHDHSVRAVEDITRRRPHDLCSTHEGHSSVEKCQTYAVENVEFFAKEKWSYPCLGGLLSYKPNAPLFYDAHVRYVYLYSLYQSSERTVARTLVELTIFYFLLHPYIG